MQKASPQLWIMLGECHSKCEHLAGVPLDRLASEYLHIVYLAKGVAATTAIEGNTLSEEQVRDHIVGKLNVAPSQEYLRKEVDNIIKGCNLVLNEIREGVQPPLTVERIKQLNRIVLAGLELSDETVPGEIRKHSVGVGTYRGAPAEDCLYLLEQFCQWLDGPHFASKPGMEILYATIKAILAHLYLAWIHPFGDGNGRTARLMEVQILLASGIPSPAAQLLSNHYNNTRADYYRYLERARKDVLDFVTYAVSGFRDGLREQVEAVRYAQWEVAWTNHIHRTFDGLKGKPHDRRKHLVLDLSKIKEPVPYDKLRDISARVGISYKDRTRRTLFRDLKTLLKMDLIDIDADNCFRAKKEAILAFLPVRARNSGRSTS